MRACAPENSPSSDQSAFNYIHVIQDYLVVVLNPKVLQPHFRKRMPHPLLSFVSYSFTLALSRHGSRWWEGRYYSATSKPTFKDSMAEAIWRYLPFVCSYARGPRRPGPRSAGKRVERVAIREDSRESARWVAEEKRDAEAWKREKRKERKGKRGREPCIVLRAF